MKPFLLGISTASLFLRYTTEQALGLMRELGAETTEVFMATFREYEPEFGRIFVEHQHGMPVHSIHSLNQHYEPELFNLSDRTREDADIILRKVLSNGKSMGAANYTFHGRARLKKTPITIHWPTFGQQVKRVYDICREYGIRLCYENVHWTLYNYPTFMRQLQQYVPDIGATLDIKQARQSGYDVEAYIQDMGSHLATVHVSDYNDEGRICLPGRGLFDFESLFRTLAGNGFSGAVLIEVYNDSYDTLQELADSLQYLKNIRDKVFVE